MNLPANTSHMKMPQRRTWSGPFPSPAGCSLITHISSRVRQRSPRRGASSRRILETKTAPIFSAPIKRNTFSAPARLTDWTPIPGYGYRVQKDDRIRVETMIHNPTAASYDKAFLQIEIGYLR